MTNLNEGEKEVSENQKTVIKENSDLTDKAIVDLCLDTNKKTILIQFIYLFINFIILFLFLTSNYSRGFCPIIRTFRNYRII